MDRNQQAQLVREQKAGYEVLEQFNTEEARRATFADRLAGLRQIEQMAAWNERHAICRGLEDDDSAIVKQRWQKIRERYAARH